MCAIGSINFHYFHIIGDKLINPIVGARLYTHEIRIPSLKVGGLVYPQYSDNLDHGTCDSGILVTFLMLAGQV